MKVTKDLTEGNVYKNFLVFSIPLILSALLTHAYSTVDAMIAGKLISENALGAISATSSYELLFHSLINGFANGFGIYIARLFGSGDNDSIKRDTISMSVLIALFAVTISTTSIVFRAQILDYLNVDPILRPDAETYFVIYTMGYVLSYLNCLLLQTLYALGVTSFSLYVTFLSAVLNICGNLVSVLVFDWGVAGLALFTVISNAAVMLCYAIMLRRAFRELKTNGEPYRFSLSCLRSSFRYTFPTAIQQLTFHGVGVVIAPSINALGAAATTGYNVSTRLYSMGTMPLWQVSHAFACYTAQCAGKKDYVGIKRGLKVGYIMNSVMMLPFMLAIMVFAPQVVSIFFPSGYTGEAYEYALRYAVIYLPFVYIQLVGHILHAYMRSLGRVTTVFGISVFGSAVRIVSTILLVRNMSLEGAYMGQIISWVGDAILSIIIVACCYRTIEHITRVVEKTDKKAS